MQFKRTNDILYPAWENLLLWDARVIARAFRYLSGAVSAAEHRADELSAERSRAARSAVLQINLLNDIARHRAGSDGTIKQMI